MANDETKDEEDNEINDEFAPNLYGAFVRTIVCFVGEVENNDMWISKRNKKNGNHAKPLPKVSWGPRLVWPPFYTSSYLYQ